MSVRRTISLDGDWERRDFLDEAWRWSDALRRASEVPSADGPPVKASASAGWRSGRVPGSTIDDAWRTGEIANPYVDRNSLGAEWISQRTWLYRRRFDVPAGAPARATLRFDGIDPGGTLLLDGEEIARHGGMFVPLEVDLGHRLAPGSTHELVVVLDPAPPMPSQVSRSEVARLHRSRMAYGWDFCPRMVSTGIWQSAWLELRDRAWLGRPTIRTELEPDHGHARVIVGTRVEGEADGVSLVARLLDGEREVARRSEAVGGAASVGLVLEVDDPALWWPNGLGTPALHRLELRLEADGSVLDERSLAVGIRSIEAVRSTGAPPDALPYTLVVNGRHTWIRGWNWVPMDAAFGVPRADRLAHLIELARRANVNLLRVWGGGLIETEAFYDACDRAGIMVWQEFIQSSSGLTNAPADDPAFVEHMRREAEVIVPLRSHHPSLVAWCGGNELSDASGRPLDDGHPVLAALSDVVRRLDPGRLWLPTSPSGPRFDNSLAAAADEPASLHDVHGPWEHQGLAEQHALANGTTNLLHSEFGVEGAAPPETLEATVSAEHRLPVDRSNPVLAHRGAWWINAEFVERAFGGGFEPDALFDASQLLQADGLRTLIEGDRRRWPRNAGAIPWQMNEPFPNAWCTSAIDYFGIPKAAYFAVADAYAPVAVGAVVDSQVLDGASVLRLRPWVANDRDTPLEDDLNVVLHDGVGRFVGAETRHLSVPANAIGELEELVLGLGAPADDAAAVLVLDVAWAGTSRRRLLSRWSDLAPLRRLPATSVDAAVEAAGADAWRVRLCAAGDPIALDLRLADARPVGWPERSGAAYFGDNHLTLLPGEERSVLVTWHGVPPAERSLTLRGWNVAPMRLVHG